MSDAERQRIHERVRTYFTKVVDLPVEATLALENLALTKAPNLARADLLLTDGERRRHVPLVVSRDGRFLIQGQLADLTVDPYAAAMSQISLDDLPIRGDPAASVTIVKYADFQCPFSARAYATLVDALLPRYRGQVRLVIKSFPLALVHPWAEASAAAAVCARQLSVRKPESEAYWALVAYFFEHQESLRAGAIAERAATVVDEFGLSKEAFLACFEDAETLATLRAEEEEGRRLGVRSTPTLFINGRKLEGARPYDDLVGAIDEALLETPTAARPTAP